MKMVKTGTAYICEKCGVCATGEGAKQKIAKHEKTKVQGYNRSLDGLIVEKAKKYVVIVKEGMTLGHVVYYAMHKYEKKTLRPPEKSKIDEALEKSLESLLRVLPFETRFTDFYTDRILHSGREGKKLYRELSPTAFSRATARLKKMYPDLYAETEFKRTF